MFEQEFIWVVVFLGVITGFSLFHFRRPIARALRRRRPASLSAGITTFDNVEPAGRLPRFGLRRHNGRNGVHGGGSGRIEPESLSAQEFSKEIEPKLKANGGAFKRFIDIVLAAALLIVLSPIIIVAALAVKLDSSGPVFYRQTRLGSGGVPFQIVKFRSMRQDAERDGAKWAAKNDDRVTRVGRFIRKTRIDEIPQAINVLRGEMSFVGPRPERPEFVETLRREIPNYDLRHLVKPGITGWAQVKYVYGASVADAREKLTFDLYYMRHYSFWFDIAIVFMTIKVALLGVGSR